MDIWILIFALLAALGTPLTWLVFRYNKREKKKENAINWADSTKQFITGYYGGKMVASSDELLSELEVIRIKAPYIVKDCHDIGGDELGDFAAKVLEGIDLVINELKAPPTEVGITSSSIYQLNKDITSFLDQIHKVKIQLLSF